jgi:hypothetical protein
VTQFVHGDEPLVYKPEDKLRTAAPTDWIPMGVRLDSVQKAFVPQALEDTVGATGHVRATEEAESL